MPRVSARPAKCAFVFAVVGDIHVARLATALKFLKRFSRADIVVVQSRSAIRAPHDQVMEIDLPEDLDNHQASIALKTNLLAHLGHLADRYCYLDSDVIALHSEVDTVFDELVGPVRFALDHVDLDTFSPWAVKCHCTDSSCCHLREAILCSLGVEIRQCGWRLWNGGVFLFDQRAQEFFDTWHRLAQEIFCNDYWFTRDQGVLAATAWRLGLQDLAPLPRHFNFIVDRMRGVPPSKRPFATTADFHVRNDYSLRRESEQPQPLFIHFINGGVGQTGWRHWDEVAALLQTDVIAPSNVRQMGTAA